MSETDTTTETTEEVEETSPMRENFQALEEKVKVLEAENDELRPLRDKESLRAAGFDPDSDRGKALAIAIKAGEMESTPEAIADFATSTFGWDPKPVLTETETEQVSAAAQVKQIQTASVSDAPANLSDQIAEARKAGDHVEALRLQTRHAAERMLSG